MSESQMEHVLILWNQKQGDCLSKFLDLSAKGNTKKSTWTIVKNQEEFNKLKDFSEFEIIITLAELDWKGDNLIELYGIDILRELRFQKKSIAKSILISFLSLKKIREIRENKDFGISEIIKTNFVRLPKENLFSIDYLKIKLLSDSTNAINLLKFFFEIDDKYDKFNINHEQSLLGDITKARIKTKSDLASRIKLVKSINNRIDFLIKCWNKVETNASVWLYNLNSFQEFKKQFDKIQRKNMSMDDLYEIINNLEGQFIKQTEKCE